jgi:hypothetical protein
MKRIYILPLLFILFAMSCIKDRIPPVVPPVVTTGDSLLYFWDFNNGDSSNHSPSYTRAGVGTAIFNYYCAYIDTVMPGSTLNLQSFDTVVGGALRVRNPSDSIIFKMPTTGYKNVVFQFAVQRSNSGATQNAVSYTVDGTNYITTAISSNSGYTVATTFQLMTFDFSSDPMVNNNSKFAVKIQFTAANTGTTGNDRFDNVSLVGVKQ